MNRSLYAPAIATSFNQRTGRNARYMYIRRYIHNIYIIIYSIIYIYFLRQNKENQAKVHQLDVCLKEKNQLVKVVVLKIYTRLNTGEVKECRILTNSEGKNAFFLHPVYIISGRPIVFSYAIHIFAHISPGP